MQRLDDGQQLLMAFSPKDCPPAATLSETAILAAPAGFLTV
jgi:hypothetical protein